MRVCLSTHAGLLFSNTTGHLQVLAKDASWKLSQKVVLSKPQHMPPERAVLQVLIEWPL